MESFEYQNRNQRIFYVGTNGSNMFFEIFGNIKFSAYISKFLISRTLLSVIRHAQTIVFIVRILVASGVLPYDHCASSYGHFIPKIETWSQCCK